MRRAFGIIQAIMMILLVSGMMVVVMKYASISAKHTADSYIKEQAELYLNSSIEKVLLSISAFDRSSGECYKAFSESKTKRGVTYRVDIDVTRYYLVNETCSNVAYETIETEETHGMVMLEAEVTVNVDSKERVRILRRTLQRP
jgi:hypothetical protein